MRARPENCILRKRFDLHANLLVLQKVDLAAKVVDLADQRAHLRHKVDQALGDEHHAVRQPIRLSLADRVADLTRDVLERPPLRLDLLANVAKRRLRRERDLERQVRRLAPHQPDEVVVLLRRLAVRHDVADELRVELGRRVEAE